LNMLVNLFSNCDMVACGKTCLDLLVFYLLKFKKSVTSMF